MFVFSGYCQRRGLQESTRGDVIKCGTLPLRWLQQPKFTNSGSRRLLRTTLKRSFYVSFCPPPAHPSDHKKILQTLQRPTSDMRCLDGVGAVYGLTQVRDRGNIKRSFFWSVGLSVREELYGEGHCRTADRRKFLLFFRTAQLPL